MAEKHAYRIKKVRGVTLSKVELFQILRRRKIL